MDVNRVTRAAALASGAIEAVSPTGGNRDALETIVKNHAGITVSEAKRCLGAGWSAFYSALRGLERSGRVRIQSSGRWRVLHLAGRETATSPGQVLLWTRTARRIFEHVAAKPDIQVEALAKELGLKQRIVYYHLRRLVDAGLLSGRPGPRYGPLRAIHPGAPYEPGSIERVDRARQALV